MNFATDEETIRQDMGVFLIKFYELYPELKGRELYISGESYAGHYIPFIADLLTKDSKFTD